MILRIGGCEIDCDRRQVWRDGAEQRLPRKAFDLLLVLLEKRPKVVTKECRRQPRNLDWRPARGAW